MNYPQAIRRDGLAWKVNGGVNTCRGVVAHSMVGSFAAAMGELDKQTRRASWHYSVRQDGRIYCHYPDEAQTWHSGSVRNNDLIGIEHEGGLTPYDEPLTAAQLAASVALVRWLSQAHDFPLTRGAGLYEHTGLYEHNEVSDTPTACPSKRIPWQHYMDEEDELASAEYDKLLANDGEFLKALAETNRKLDQLTKDIQGVGGLTVRLQDRLNRAGIAQ